MSAANITTTKAGTGLTWLALAVCAVGMGYWLLTHASELAHPAAMMPLPWLSLAPVVVLGIAGIYLATHADMTPHPLAHGVHLATVALLVAGAFGIATALIDIAVNFAETTVAERLAPNFAAPMQAMAMIYECGIGAMTFEFLYRFIPIAFLYAAVSRLMVSDRVEAIVFWLLGIAASLVEPFAEAIAAGQISNLVWIFLASLFAFNLSETVLWRKYGWIAPLFARFTYYAVSHAF